MFSENLLSNFRNYSVYTRLSYYREQFVKYIGRNARFLCMCVYVYVYGKFYEL